MFETGSTIAIDLKVFQSMIDLFSYLKRQNYCQPNFKINCLSLVKVIKDVVV